MKVAYIWTKLEPHLLYFQETSLDIECLSYRFLLKLERVSTVMRTQVDIISQARSLMTNIFLNLTPNHSIAYVR